jgi:hypothetical protein
MAANIRPVAIKFMTVPNKTANVQNARDMGIWPRHIAIM